MKVFAISDLHLSSTVEKPMDIFGANWDNHFDRITEDWNARVSDDDLVLLGGDMSWGMNMDEAEPDYLKIAALKGRKVVLKGNHDLYWNSLIKMKSRFPQFEFLQNNALRFTPSGNSEDETGVVIAGTRGWNIPSKDASDADTKIYRRELIRLELSLNCANKIRRDGDKLVVMLHFPPFEANYADTDIISLIEKYSADYVLYGHLHGKNVRVNTKVDKRGVPYLLTSCDLIDCKLVEVCGI